MAEWPGALPVLGSLVRPAKALTLGGWMPLGGRSAMGTSTSVPSDIWMYRELATWTISGGTTTSGTIVMGTGWLAKTCSGATCRGAASARVDGALAKAGRLPGVLAATLSVEHATAPWLGSAEADDAKFGAASVPCRVSW
jgi:hypothetical protein